MSCASKLDFSYPSNSIQPSQSVYAGGRKKYTSALALTLVLPPSSTYFRPPAAQGETLRATSLCGAHLRTSLERVIGFPTASWFRFGAIRASDTADSIGTLGLLYVRNRAVNTSTCFFFFVGRGYIFFSRTPLMTVSERPVVDLCVCVCFFFSCVALPRFSCTSTRKMLHTSD